MTSFRFRALPAALNSKIKRGALRNLVRQMGPLRGPFVREIKVETGRCNPRSLRCDGRSERYFTVQRDPGHEGDHCEEGKKI